MTLEELNHASRADAEQTLLACCNSTRWAAALLARRPFASPDALLSESDAVWHDMGPNDWREALSGHPRIGERSTSSDARVRAWSAGEQAAATQNADGETLRALAHEGNEYIKRFGHIFLVCASGKPAEALLESLRQRMHNAPDVELRVAAEEVRKITRLRLAKLLDAPGETRS